MNIKCKTQIIECTDKITRNTKVIIQGNYKHHMINVHKSTSYYQVDKSQKYAVVDRHFVVFC